MNAAKQQTEAESFCSQGKGEKPLFFSGSQQFMSSKRFVSNQHVCPFQSLCNVITEIRRKRTWCDDELTFIWSNSSYGHIN